MLRAVNNDVFKLLTLFYWACVWCIGTLYLLYYLSRQNETVAKIYCTSHILCTKSMEVFSPDIQECKYSLCKVNPAFFDERNTHTFTTLKESFSHKQTPHNCQHLVQHFLFKGR